MLVHDAPAPLDKLDAVVLQYVHVDAVQAPQFCVFLGQKRVPVEGDVLRNVPAKPAGVGKVFGKGRRVDKELFRHAATQHARAACAALGVRGDGVERELADGHAGAIVSSRHARGAHPTASGADGKQVIVVVGGASSADGRNAMALVECVSQGALERHMLGMCCWDAG